MDDYLSGKSLSYSCYFTIPGWLSVAEHLKNHFFFLLDPSVLGHVHDDLDGPSHPKAS